MPITNLAPKRLGWRLLRRVLTALLRLAVLTALLLFCIHGYVYWGSVGQVYSVADAPSRPVALVLGASVWPNGQPSAVLEDRLRAALELYQAGKVAKILVSGDHGQEHYDEVRVMAKYLEDRGVPAADVFMDHAGFRTLDSMYRAKIVFGIEALLVVSNPFHVPRALFLGEAVGLRVDGVAANYGVRYSAGTRWKNATREIFARILAFADVHILGTEPRFLGPRINIRGDGRLTRDRGPVKLPD
jgi:SanA protein